MLPEWTRRAPASRNDESDARPPQVSTTSKPPRTRSIRLRITALLLIPLLSLVVLWAFAANATLGAALSKFSISTVYDKLGTPGVFLSTQLQQERTLAATYVGSRGRQGLQPYQAQRARTDVAQAYFRKNVSSPELADAAGEATKQQLTEVIRRLDGLSALRAGIESNRRDLVTTIAGYSAIIDSAQQLFSSTVIVDDIGILQQGNGLISLGRARDYMLREDALVLGVQASRSRMTAAQHTAFVQWSANQRRSLEIGLANLTGTLRDSMRRVTDSPEFVRFQSIEDVIINASLTSPTPKVKGKSKISWPQATAGWQTATTPVGMAWGQAINQAGAELNQRAKPIADGIVFRLVLVGGLGLLAVVASILVSILFVRNLSRELVGLQRAARDLAEERLPRVVARLRSGEEVDPEAEAPPLQVGRTTEIARVAEAFTRVQRTAINTAVGEAYLRKGVSRVFLNLAWRSQSLLHRQLRMLDAMERRATEPEELEDLFRLDHLTTRMRRHAEGLVILSGAPAGRGWSRPVRIVDVMRGALGEVEDYTRVDVVSSSPASLAAAAVADVIHLLAELIENGTAFSPPPTEVVVRGETVANGFAVEIVDRGIGLSPAELSELNARLVRPPEFDLADSDRLGLFVVSRLAARHRIRVTLQQSAYGGTTAVVLIPHELIIQNEERELNAPDGRAEGSWVRRPGGAAQPPTGPSDWFEARQLIGNVPDAPEPVAPVTLFGSPSAGTVAADSIDDDELPRRVRQASLVPQLRKEPAAADGAAEVERRPEESRDLMSSLQTGWLRGRGDEEEDRLTSEHEKEWGDS